MKTIRCGRGLGDSLYLQSVVRHLLETTGETFKVRSDWPDVFRPLAPRVEVTPFSRLVDVVAHYSARKGHAGTTQFEDCCAGAGLADKKVDLRLDWTVGDKSLVHPLLALGRQIVVVQLPRNPMGRIDGFGKELLPDCKVIQRCIDALRERALIVQVGSGVPLFKFKGIDVDLANRTSVSQLIDVAAVADGFLGYCSFMVPLAESFSKPALFVWSSRGLRAGHIYVRQITPKKVLHRASSQHVVDDWDPARIDEVINAFLR